MECGTIDVDSLPGGFDLRHTLESGQTYRWRRPDARGYEGGTPGSWYETVLDGSYVRVRQRNGVLEWEANGDATQLLVDRLRLDDDLPAIYQAFPSDPLVDRAVERFHGMRLVRDPVFPCLISFICSAQMRVDRIYRMQQSLSRAYGDPITVEGARIHAFPRPAQLAATTEDELRALGLGYRAPYVQATAEMVADGIDPSAAADMPYEEAREYLTRFVGVGEKVADCVLLFALDFLEAVPLDTWIRTAIEDAYPHCDLGSYGETSAAIRREFGEQYAGYAQTYVFHLLRTID